MCHDKQLVVSTSTQILLEFACITPSPQLHQECRGMHDLVEMGQHIYKEKKFQSEISGDSSQFKHPHFFFISSAVHVLA